MKEAGRLGRRWERGRWNAVRTHFPIMAGNHQHVPHMSTGFPISQHQNVILKFVFLSNLQIEAESKEFWVDSGPVVRSQDLKTTTALPKEPKPIVSQECVGWTHLALEGPWNLRSSLHGNGQAWV